MADLPADYPGTWAQLPVEVRAMLAQRLVERALKDHGGAGGIIQHLYRGTHREQAIGEPIRISYTAAPREIWPHVLTDARLWLDERQVAKVGATAVEKSATPSRTTNPE